MAPLSRAPPPTPFQPTGPARRAGVGVSSLSFSLDLSRARALAPLATPSLSAQAPGIRFLSDNGNTIFNERHHLILIILSKNTHAQVTRLTNATLLIEAVFLRLRRSSPEARGTRRMRFHSVSAVSAEEQRPTRALSICMLQPCQRFQTDPRVPPTRRAHRRSASEEVQPHPERWRCARCVELWLPLLWWLLLARTT